MKACDKYLELISIYLDNGIMDDELKEHLESCAYCRDELAAMESLLSELNALEELPLPEGFHERAMERLKEVHKSASPLPLANYISIAASVILCFILLGGALTAVNTGFVNRTPNYIADGLIALPTGAPAALSIATEAHFLHDTPVVNNHDLAGGMPVPESAIADIQAPPAAPPPPQAARRGEPEEAIEYGYRPRYMTREQYPPPDLAAGTRGAVHSDHISVISRDASIIITVDDMDLAVRTMRMAGFEIESSNVSESFSSFTLRVPNIAYENIKILARSLGESTFEREHATDLTHATNELAIMYMARLEEGRRLTALITGAQRADDILLLQNRISQVERDKAIIRGSYNQNLDRSQNYILTINLHTEGSAPIHLERTFTERISGAFTGSVNFTTSFFEGTLVVISYTFLPLVLIAALGATGYFSFKKFVKRGQK